MRAHVMNANTIHALCRHVCQKLYQTDTNFLRVGTRSKTLALAFETLSACSAVKTMSAFDVRRKLKTIGRISVRKSANVQRISNLLVQLDSAKTSCRRKPDIDVCLQSRSEKVYP